MRQSSSRAKPKPKPSKKAPKIVYSQSVALVLIDAEPLRQRERSRYAERCRQADEAASQMRAFEEDEVPAFTSWLDREFEREIGLLRSEQARVHELEALALDVERYAAWTGVSFGVALARLNRAKAEGTEGELWREVTGEGEDDDEDMGAAFTSDDDGPGGRRPGEDADEAFARMFAEAFTDDAGPRAGARAQGRGHQQPKSPSDLRSEAYLKTIYRQLVRALHPDSNQREPDGQLWQQVQDAYSCGDISRLERLQKQVFKGLKAGLDLERAPIGDIIGLRQSVEGRLRKLRHSLKTAAGHPAWNFLSARAAPAKLRLLKRQLGAAMADDLLTMQQERRQLEAWISSWRAPGKTKASKRQSQARARF